MAKRNNPKAPAAPRPEPPPNTPSERALLERAIVLLGHRANGLDFRRKAREELVALVGGYPKPPRAANWKFALMQVRDDEIFDHVG